VGAAYLDLLAQEVALVGEALGSRPQARQVHLGGGSPTFLTAEELRRLHGILSEAFDLSEAVEMAVEVDPRSTSFEQLGTLAKLGWNRASFGVQDFDPQVQKAINREQSVELTEALVHGARGLGYRGINVDLIYGLPFQREETFQRTLAQVLTLEPDRIALYSYAHVPWLRVAQRRFDAKAYPLPGPQEKYALFRLAAQTFLQAGYVHLGMDHFAKPEDDLAQAQAAGSLHRNFQGYTVRHADDLVGLGISAISDLAETYAQNAKDLGDYEDALARGELPTQRGYALQPEEVSRRTAIMALMTGSPLPPDFARDFAPELETLGPLEADGLVERTPEGIRVTPVGRFFLRNVAMHFDPTLPKGGGGRPRVFSRTV
jgi:oxygen-independent coproporphyrinogen-3 oxidase